MSVVVDHNLLIYSVCLRQTAATSHRTCVMCVCVSTNENIVLQLSEARFEYKEITFLNGFIEPDAACVHSWPTKHFYHYYDD